MLLPYEDDPADIPPFAELLEPVQVGLVSHEDCSDGLLQPIQGPYPLQVVDDASIHVGCRPVLVVLYAVTVSLEGNGRRDVLVEGSEDPVG